MKFQYTNHRGETTTRNVTPLTLTYFDNPAAVSPHLAGYSPGYFLEALDLDRNKTRHFYLGFDPAERLKNIAPGDGWPIQIADPNLVKAAVDKLAELAGEKANLGLATNAKIERDIAARKSLGHTDPNYSSVGGDDGRDGLDV